VLQRAEEAEHKEADPLPPVDAPLPVAGAQGYSCRTDYAHRGYGQRAAGSKVMSLQAALHRLAEHPGLGRRRRRR
jgi:hypothetical protein